jgi:hypothetical protein
MEGKKRMMLLLTSRGVMGQACGGVGITIFQSVAKGQSTGGYVKRCSRRTAAKEATLTMKMIIV